jgi:hypothetical protein
LFGNVFIVGAKIKTYSLIMVVKDLTYYKSIFTETLSPSASNTAGKICGII